MAEITAGGLWVRWSSLTRRDKWEFALSMGMLFTSGFLTGFAAGWFKGEPAAVTSDRILVGLAPMLPLVLGGWLYLRFVLRQDELFRLFHLITSLWTLVGAMLVILPGMTLERVLGMPVVSVHHVLYGAALFSILGGIWASRRYL
ncbi:MAG: hypothetical protein RLY86_2451 [Pseudomonadota bacterium]